MMEWVDMPFGVCNAPPTVQRMMNNIVRDLLHKFVTVYLDDVDVCTCTPEEHLQHLRLVLQCFKEEGLKLRLENASSVFKRWSTWAVVCLLFKFPFRQRKSRPL
jgi:hypothetical protein